MASTCLISCYFGSWPKYVDLFLESCRHNPEFEFLLFSDCGSLPSAPGNVHVVPMTLDEIRDRIRKRLGLEPAIKTPYNLCDFKPTYGALFDDYLDGYDFWGCTDIDMIYGDIGSFITDDLLAANDVISARAPYLTGFFFLFRNEDRLNSLYTQSADYKWVLESEQHFSFTECNSKWDALIDGASVFDVDTEIESMTEVIRREEKAGRLRTHFSDLGCEVFAGTRFTWDDGKLLEFIDGEAVERMLIHFVILKGRYYFTFPDWDEVPSRFHVLPTGFYRDDELQGLKYLKALPVGTIGRRWWEQTMKKVQRRFP